MLGGEVEERATLDRAPRVVVLGAGLAGLVAADALSEQGLSVTVVEAAPFAGGRTSSWTDRDGFHCDSGLHVVAGHYHHLRALLASLGLADTLAWQFRHRYVRPGRPDLILEHNALPPPFHLLRTAVRIPLGVRMRLRLAQVALRVASFSHEQLTELDSQTYAEWQRTHRLESDFIAQLTEFGADACAFMRVDDISAYTLLTWLRSMSASRALSAIAPFPGPIGKVLIQPLVGRLLRRGVRFLFSTAAAGLEVRAGRVRSVLLRETRERTMFCAADGTPELQPSGGGWSLTADWVVSALPVQALARLLSAEQVAALGLPALHRLRTVPALSATVFFDRPIAPSPAGVVLAAGYRIRDFVDLREVWPAGAAGPGSSYQLLAADAAQQLHLDDASIVAGMLADLHRAWPPVRAARVLGWTLQRIGAAMFEASPGAYALRPPPATAFDNFILAGDWTRHDFNASMEGAVYSGLRAGRAIQRRLEASRRLADVC